MQVTDCHGRYHHRGLIREGISNLEEQTEGSVKGQDPTKSLSLGRRGRYATPPSISYSMRWTWVVRQVFMVTLII